jgi:hypothetical protein
MLSTRDYYGVYNVALFGDRKRLITSKFSRTFLAKTFQLFLQKFSTNKRQLGGTYSTADADMARFPWFSLAGLEQFSTSMAALQPPFAGDDEDEAGNMMTRGDSGDSNESLGDVPIELRHLEGDFYAAVGTPPMEPGTEIPKLRIDAALYALGL